jgi:2-iminobutanoate/2-iminopropanoate deaminase
MTLKESVVTDKAPAQPSLFSQAIKCNGMVYCSGSIGIEPTTMKLVEGGVADRTVSRSLRPLPTTDPLASSHITSQKQALTNLSEVLKAAGSSIDNVVKVNIFLTNMENYAAMNKAYETFFSKEPKPCRTCVAVHQLPFGTDVEIELTAHL